MGSIATVRFLSLIPALLRRHHHLHIHSTLSPHHPPSLFSSLSPLHCTTPKAPLSTKAKTTTNIPYLWPELSHFSSNCVDTTTTLESESDNSDHTLFLILEDGHNLPRDFVKAAKGCLAFARDNPDLLWSLPKEDIEVVVDSGSPSLFKDGTSAMRRMKSFLRGGLHDVIESEKPSTVDLMICLLNYARMALLSSEDVPTMKRIESSVRKLFSELAGAGGSATSVASVRRQFPDSSGQQDRSVGHSITMKRGDWICPRCRFMNFAKNGKCRECEEPRPRKVLTGGEWECPVCDYVNFGRNKVCLRCSCKRLEANLSQSPNFYLDVSPSSHIMERSLGGNKEQPRNWLEKISELEKSSDNDNTIAVEYYPKHNHSERHQFAFSTRNMGVEGNSKGQDINFEISQYLDKITGENDRDASMSEISNSPGIIGHKESDEAENYERSFKEVPEPHNVKNLPNAVNDDDLLEVMPMREGDDSFPVSKKYHYLTSPMHKRHVAMEQSANTNRSAPYVPFPPGYFAKNKPDEGSSAEGNGETTLRENNDTKFTSNQQSPSVTASSKDLRDRKEDRGSVPVQEASNSMDDIQRSGEYTKTTSTSSIDDSLHETGNQSTRDSWRGRSLEGSAVKEPDPLDMSEEAKAERWFRRVSQIKDISELSQIPDEDFPSIMPIRKGVNRFVVSKRKTPLERRLTSSKYRGNLPSVSPDPVKDSESS